MHIYIRSFIIVTFHFMNNIITSNLYIFNILYNINYYKHIGINNTYYIIQRFKLFNNIKYEINIVPICNTIIENTLYMYI